MRFNLLANVICKHQFTLTRRNISSGSYQAAGPFNFIDGKRCDTIQSKEKCMIVEPATGKVIGSFNESDDVDVNLAIEKSAQAQQEWAQITPNERGQLLIEVARTLKKRQEEIARVEVYDNGKAIWETRFDVQTAIDSLQYYGGLAASLSGEFFKFQEGSFGYTIREPLGVVAGIGAWNYPIQMAGWKSAPALACGNAVVFKPSQFTPMSAVMLAEVFMESGLPANLFNVVQGGAKTGNLLSSHPQVAKVSFTGSVATGGKVMTNCAQDIKHVTLELGGKSPLIIFEDCDKANAVKGALMANFLTQGQVCSNGTRVYIQEEIFDEVVAELKIKTESIQHGDPHHEDTKMGAMIHAEQGAITRNFIDRAISEGAQIICGGQYREMKGVLSGGCYIDPCILRAEDHMEITREEVFGPVMNVYPFKTEEEVIARANDSKFGLSGGVFTKDLNRAHRVAAKLQTGTININNYNILPVEIPFGGYKRSGLGRENGAITIEYFSQLKSVYVEANDVWCPY